MDGWCRNPGNGILHPKSNNEWGYCLKGKWDLSACKNKCDADKDCWAFDRETKALSECCLFGHGNLGHSCFVAEEKGALIVWYLDFIIDAKSIAYAMVYAFKILIHLSWVFAARS